MKRSQGTQPNLLFAYKLPIRLLNLGVAVLLSCNAGNNDKLAFDISHVLRTEDSVVTLIRNEADNDLIRLKFYPDLQIKEITELKNGRQHGKNIVWRDNGSIWVESYFENGERNGVLREFRSNGRTGFEGERVNGKFEGINNEFYESGALKERWTRRGGENLGPVISYHENGLIKEIGENTSDGYKTIKSYDSTGVSTADL